jgi:hypothetical protein
LSGPEILGGDDRFHLLAVLEGIVEIAGEKFTAGETCLLPAAAGQIEAIPADNVTLLDAYLPSN